MVEKIKKTKRKILRSPSAFAGLFLVIIIMAALTWVIPSGSYDTKKDPDDPSKTVRISGTYKESPKFTVTKEGKKEVIKDDVRQGAWDVAMAPVKGMTEKLDVIVFVMILGGFLGVVMKTGALDAMLGSMLLKMKGKEKWLIPILMIFFAIGGTTYGMQEETVAFYALIIPIMIAAGYNAMTAVLVIVLGSGAGLIGSTINPFSTGIAARTADMPLANVFPIQFTVLGLSLIAAIVFTMRYAAKVKSGKYAKDDRTKPTVATTLDMSSVPKFTGTRKAIMAIFGLTFVIMILSLIPWEDFGVKVFSDFHTWLANLPVFGAVMGVSHNVALGNWYFSEISVLFLASAILVGFIYRKEFKKQDVALVDTFIKGIGDLLPVALIIAVATGVSVVMNNGAIQDTVIHWGEDLLKSANGSIVGILAFIFYLPMSVLIPSSSGLAAATMPILAPIADLVGAGKDMIVAGYSTAVGLVNLVAPTIASLMGGLALAGVSYRKYLLRTLPIMIIFAIICMGTIAVFGVL